MNRRNFLKGLAALGVSLVVAEKLVALAEAPPPAVRPMSVWTRMQPLADVYSLDKIEIMGCEDQSRYGEFILARSGGGLLLNLSLNTYGGMVMWRPRYPGESIVATREHTLEIMGNFDGVARIYGRTEQCSVWHQFAMVRGDGPHSRVLQLDNPQALLSHGA